MSIKELVAKIKSGEVKSYDVVKSYVDTINKKEEQSYDEKSMAVPFLCAKIITEIVRQT